MTEKELEVIKQGYEKYNSFYIIPVRKRFFGKEKIIFQVESFDTIVFKNTKLDECHHFCDDFIKNFNQRRNNHA